MRASAPSAPHRRVRLLPQPRKSVRGIPEAKLRRLQRLAAAAAVPIEDRQQGQADPRLRRRRGDAVRELREMVVGRASRLMMDVVKLRHRGEAGLQHLHLGEGGDRFELVRPDPFEKPVHEPAPGPEAVARIGPSLLGQAGHGALKGVAVQIRRRGQEDSDAASLRGRFGLDCGDAAVAGDLHPHAAPPSLARQRLLRPQCFHHPLLPGTPLGRAAHRGPGLASGARSMISRLRHRRLIHGSG